MIEKANRDKAKDEWVGRAPEPKILVQDVKHDNCEYQQDLFHDVSAKPFWQKQSRTNRRLYQVNSSTLENCYGKNCCLRCVLKHKLRLNRATLYHEEGDRTRLSNKLSGSI
jgi:hypothetical protein